MADRSEPPLMMDPSWSRPNKDERLCITCGQKLSRYNRSKDFCYMHESAGNARLRAQKEQAARDKYR